MELEQQFSFLPLFSWHIQATLSQLSQAVKEALWNMSHTHLAQINLCWTDFLMLIKSLETVKTKWDTA